MMRCTSRELQSEIQFDYRVSAYPSFKPFDYRHYVMPLIDIRLLRLSPLMIATMLSTLIIACVNICLLCFIVFFNTSLQSLMII